MKFWPLPSILYSFLAAAQTLTPGPQFANDWMKAPSDVAAKDETMRSLRIVRDQIFDKAIGTDSPLTPETASAVHSFEGAYYGEEPEIPQFEHRVIVIGTLTKVRSILTASGRAIYSEVSIHVQNVFERSGGQPSAESEITMIVPGGTVRTTSGQVISFFLRPRKDFVQPGKSYLMLLEYHQEGDYYSHGKNWDVSDGIVRANSDVERQRASQGTSTLVGLNPEQLIQTLTERFSK